MLINNDNKSVSAHYYQWAGMGGGGRGRIAVFSVAYSVEGWPLKAGRGDRSLGMGPKGCSCLFMADSS